MGHVRDANNFKWLGVLAT